MRRLALSLMLVFSALPYGTAASAQPSHAIAMHGEPALAAEPAKKVSTVLRNALAAIASGRGDGR